MGGQGPGYGKDFGSHSTVEMHRVTDPSDALDQVIQQNHSLKEANDAWEESSRKWAEEKEQMVNEMKQLAQFRQILKNPIEKLTVELYDDELLRQIRGLMIKMFGTGGHMDAEGRWAQGVVNHRFQLLLRQLLFNGMQRWPQVKAQLDEIIKQQGLMT